MKKSNALATIECVNCGFKAWSLYEPNNCPRCGATVVGTSPTVTNKELRTMPLEDVIELSKRQRAAIVVDNGIPHLEWDIS